MEICKIAEERRSNAGRWNIGLLGSDRASSKGDIVRWVEAPSNKLLTTAFEASLESAVVTLQAKRRQQDNRDSYWAPKSQSHQRVDIVVWMEDNICIYANFPGIVILNLISYIIKLVFSL